MSKVELTDLLLVNRAGVDYKMTGADFQAATVIHSNTAPTLTTHPSLVNGSIWIDGSKDPAELNLWNSAKSKFEVSSGGGGGGLGAPPATLPGDTLVLEQTQVASATQQVEFSIAAGPWVDAGTAAAMAVIAVRWKAGLEKLHPAGTVLTEKVTFTKTSDNSKKEHTYTLTIAYPALTKLSDTTVAGVTNVGSTLTATPGTATGGVPTYTYATRWQRSATGTGGWVDIAGAAGTTYVLVTADGNNFVRAVTTATDSAFNAQTLQIPSASSVSITATVIPDINTVTLADDAPGGSRFTSQTFTSTVVMTQDGVPASAKGIKAWVEGTLTASPQTSAITNVSTNSAGPLTTEASWTPCMDMSFAQTNESWMALGGNNYVRFIRDDGAHRVRIWHLTGVANPGSISVGDARWIQGADILSGASQPDNTASPCFGSGTWIVFYVYSNAGNGIGVGATNDLGVTVVNCDWTYSTSAQYICTGMAYDGSCGFVGKWARNTPCPAQWLYKINKGSTTMTPVTTVRGWSNASGSGGTPFFTTSSGHHLLYIDTGPLGSDDGGNTWKELTTLGWNLPAGKSGTQVGGEVWFKGTNTAEVTTDFINYRTITIDTSHNGTWNGWGFYSVERHAAGSGNYGTWISVDNHKSWTLLRDNQHQEIGPTWSSVVANHYDPTVPPMIAWAGHGWATATAPMTTLTFADNTALANILGGESVDECDAAGAALDGKGVAISTNTTAKQLVISPTAGTFDVGSHVKGPSKKVAGTKLYAKLSTTLAVTDLQSADPGYTAFTGLTPQVSFPATLPSGNPPDTDLPASTTLQTEVKATNSTGSDTVQSAKVTPA